MLGGRGTVSRRTTGWALLILSLTSTSVRAGYVLQPRSGGKGFGQTKSATQPPSFHVRLATARDIPAIRNCNVANLPENYSDDFYKRHLLLWPRLAIVAEVNDAIVGYTLGRVDTQPSTRTSTSNIPDIGNYSPPQTIGHVASIAVYKEFRKLGVAKALMNMLHEQMGSELDSPVDTVSLHCRVSNEQAIRLYSGYFPYQCISIVPSYYADNEDAWLMRLANLQTYLAGRKGLESVVGGSALQQI